MEINQFVELSIYQVKKGIDEFNKKTSTTKAYYPEFIDLELFVDSNGSISNDANQQITIRIPMAGYIHQL